MHALRTLLIPLLLICSHSLLSRDPFTFDIPKEQNTPPPAPIQTTSLSKWNIKDVGNGLLIVENNDNGQIRTIDISSFDKK